MGKGGPATPTHGGRASRLGSTLTVLTEYTPWRLRHQAWRYFCRSAAGDRDLGGTTLYTARVFEYR